MSTAIGKKVSSFLMLVPIGGSFEVGLTSKELTSVFRIQRQRRNSGPRRRLHKCFLEDRKEKEVSTGTVSLDLEQ